MSTASKSTKRKVDAKISKQSLDEAIACIYEDEDDIKKNDKMSASKKMKRECLSASLKAQNMKSLAEDFSPEQFQTELLEELRVSLLENNVSGIEKILKLLVDSGNKMLAPIIWKSAAVVFLSRHPKSYEHHEEFLVKCVGKRSPEDKLNFLKKLRALPDLLAGLSSSCRKKSEDSVHSLVLSDDENDKIFC